MICSATYRRSDDGCEGDGFLNFPVPAFPLPAVLLEAISKLGFSVEISSPRSAGQEREAEDQPARLLTGSPTRILKYVEDLIRGLNTDIGRKDFFEMASIIEDAPRHVPGEFVCMPGWLGRRR